MQYTSVEKSNFPTSPLSYTYYICIIISDESQTAGLAAGVVIGVIFIIVLILISVWCCKRHERRLRDERSKVHVVELPNKAFEDEGAYFLTPFSEG